MGTGPSKHHAYRLRGSDHFGEVEVFRRYKEFDRLRAVFVDRYPGLFVPPLPPKKKIVKDIISFILIRIKQKKRLFKKGCFS
jgi:hypothetical protein